MHRFEERVLLCMPVTDMGLCGVVSLKNALVIIGVVDMLLGAAYVY